MTAALSINQPLANDRDRSATVTAAPEQQQLSFAGFQARAIPATILLTFALIAGSMYWYRGDAPGAVGLGLFMAFWLGGGFGFLIGGVLYGLQVEASHD